MYFASAAASAGASGDCVLRHIPGRSDAKSGSYLLGAPGWRPRYGSFPTVMDSREIVFGIAMVVQEIKNPLPERAVDVCKFVTLQAVLLAVHLPECRTAKAWKTRVLLHAGNGLDL